MSWLGKKFWGNYPLVDYRINKGHLELLTETKGLVIASFEGDWAAMSETDIWAWIVEQEEFREHKTVYYAAHTPDGNYIADYPEALVAFQEFYGAGIEINKAMNFADFVLEVFLDARNEFNVASFASLLIREQEDNDADIYEDYVKPWRLGDAAAESTVDAMLNYLYFL